MDTFTFVILAIVLAMVATGGFAVWRFRRTAPATGGPGGSRLGVTLLSLVIGGALVVAALALVSAIMTVVQTIIATATTVAGMPIGNASRPPITDGVTGVADARYDSATLVIEGLPAAARWLLATEPLLASITTAGLALVVAWLCARVVRERPFARAVPPVIGGVAILVLLNGLGSQLTTAMGRAEAIRFLGERELTSVGPDNGEAFASFALGLDLSSFGWAMALAVVVGVFEVGRRLQGERDRLAEETRGLV
ncbi:hypothetical protein [Agromyces archimandritae]|uniref:Uncharacterized protein n=1 Tax=Agromyces archimandritae TaxID=2781962 RepID=A0A975FN68_9MICO|nr:hypothetical protein [Agromyces archimandritae]QTX05553.1 hypothetical protein G127AT_04890 [Agromyces archimandritae]